MAGRSTKTASGTPELASRGDERYLAGEHTPEQLAAALAVGYHNYFRVGLSEARALVARRCPDGWAVTSTDHDGAPVPAGAVRVGQVRVIHGDPDHALYIYPLPGRWPAATSPRGRSTEMATTEQALGSVVAEHFAGGEGIPFNFATTIEDAEAARSPLEREQLAVAYAYDQTVERVEGCISDVYNRPYNADQRAEMRSHLAIVRAALVEKFAREWEARR